MASIIFKWLRRCLFICLFAFFFMSHNASALDFLNTGLVSFSSCYITTSSGTFNGSITPEGTCGVNFQESLTMYGMTAYFTGWIPRNSLLNINVRYFWTDSNSFQYFSPTWSRYFQKLSEQCTQNDGTTMSCSYLVYTSGDVNNFGTSGDRFGTFTGIGNQVAINRVGFVTLAHQPTQQDLYNFATATQNNFDLLNSNINDIKDYLDGLQIPTAEENADAIADKQTDATQDAADEAADSGDQSAADAENATAGLISVIGGFVNAITSATPTNCKINGKINNSFNMGELDLCSMPVPPFVQIISSLILIAICIPFAIVMFNRFIGLFRSFQG